MKKFEKSELFPQNFGPSATISGKENRSSKNSNNFLRSFDLPIFSLKIRANELLERVDHPKLDLESCPLMMSTALISFVFFLVQRKLFIMCILPNC